MKTAATTPYLLPPAGAVSDHPWTMGDDRALPDRLDHWDPFTDTEVQRMIEVDVDAVRDCCRLGTDATFAVTASWYSSRTRLGGTTDALELGDLGGLVRGSLGLLVPGSAAGGRLDLRTRLILRHPGASPTPISPRREGAILWAEETRVALEGASSRFPITALDFGEVPRLPDDASWGLEWNPEDLEAPVLGGLRLIVNARDDALLGALRSGSAESRATVIRSFVMFDVARTLVHGALGNERFIDDPDCFDEGSVGRMLSELLSLCWPGMPLRTLVARAREDPARFEAELQAHLGVLR